jgi:hypothetical protein
LEWNYILNIFICQGFLKKIWKFFYLKKNQQQKMYNARHIKCAKKPLFLKFFRIFVSLL